MYALRPLSYPSCEDPDPVRWIFHRLAKTCGLVASQVAEDELRRLMKALDVRGDGRIEYDQFVAAALEAQVGLGRNQGCRNAARQHTPAPRSC
jgi:hypothetical protein